MLGVEPDYLRNFIGFVLVQFGPQTPTGGVWGGFPPHDSCKGVYGEKQLDFEPPLVGVQGKCPQKVFFGKMSCKIL